MELKDTIDMMLSEDYKERFKAEYHQTKIRYEKLHQMCIKYEAGVLTFEPTCSLELLKQQKAAMGHYLQYLEIRAELEHIDLQDVATMKTCECAGEEGCGCEANPVEDYTCGACYSLSFSDALEAIKKGHKAARLGMESFIMLIDNVEFHTEADISQYEGKEITVGAALAKWKFHSIEVGWVPTQEDMLAEDWTVF